MLLDDYVDRMLVADSPAVPYQKGNAVLRSYRTVDVRWNPAYFAWVNRFTCDIVTDTNRICQEHGVKLMLGTYLSSAINSIPPAIARELRLPLFNIGTRENNELFNARGYFVGDHWHLNDAGTRYLAELFAVWFLRQVESDLPAINDRVPFS